MSELEQLLVGQVAHAAPKRVLEGIDSTFALHKTPGATHTIYEEVWHLAFWQQISLEWARGIETPCPEHASVGFATSEQIAAEPWDAVRKRFLQGTEDAAAITRDAAALQREIRCPSPAGEPVRTMTIREQLENLAAHNAYHLGRVVLLRQINNAWPPASGGFTW
jgi:DinB superfamily